MKKILVIAPNARPQTHNCLLSLSFNPIALNTTAGAAMQRPKKGRSVPKRIAQSPETIPKMKPVIAILFVTISHAWKENNFSD